MSVRIIKASSLFYEKFLDVFEEIEILHRRNVPWKFKKPEKELFSKSIFDDLIRSDEYLFLLAIKKFSVVGYVLASKKRSSDLPILRKREWIQIDDLAVKSNYRKLGIGMKLMKEVEKWAISQYINEIELNVYHFNQHAIDFYEKNGFRGFSQKMMKTVL